MPRKQPRKREPQNLEYEPWTQWFCSVPGVTQDAAAQPQYAWRYAHWEDGGMTMQVLYYEEGDGWRLHCWEKGDGLDDGPDRDTWKLRFSIPMEFRAAWNNIKAAVGEFKNKTKPGSKFPWVSPRIPPWHEGYRGVLFEDETSGLKGPPPEAYP